MVILYYLCILNYKDVYISHFGYGEFIPCEMCGKPADEVHHIHRRGMGGSKLWDIIENLMALCRKHHTIYGDIKSWKAMLYKKHMQRLKALGKPFNEAFILEQIRRYE